MLCVIIVSNLVLFIHPPNSLSLSKILFQSAVHRGGSLSLSAIIDSATGSGLLAAASSNVDDSSMIIAS